MTGDDQPVGNASGDDRSSIGAVYEERVDGSHPLAALLRRYLPGREGVAAVAVGSTVAWRLANLVAPYLLGVALDAFFVGEGRLSVAFVPDAWVPATTRGQFAFLLALFAAVGLGSVGANAVRVASWRWVQGAVLHDLRVDAYDATQRLDVAFFDAEQSGDVASVLTDDVNQLRGFLGDGLQDALQTGAFVVALLAVMLGLHWQLTLVAAGFVPAMVGVVAAYRRVVQPRYDDRRAAMGRLHARVQTAVDGVETVKAFTAEDRERSRLAAASRAFWRADWQAARLSAAFFPAREAVSQAAMLAILVVGGWWAAFGPPLDWLAPLSVGTFVAFYFYGQMFVSQSARVGDVADAYADATASAKRVFGLLHHPAAEPTGDDAADLDGVEGRIEFDGVTFTYPDADSPALRDVSFAVEPGEFVGLVGPTGAGKSTALKLLLRFYDPDDGTITVDGVDVADASADSLREAVSYVSQEPFLFDGTVRENIAYGAPDADGDAVVAAAKRARAHEFIADLPDGYDTRVGERGVKLSGGQRQRVAIARAVLADPDVLVLDEATSHVDNRTELLVQASLREVAAGRTTFAVAHRLSTVRNADRILVFDDGELVEQGTHDDLVAADGLYAALWRVHTGERDALPGHVAAGP